MSQLRKISILLIRSHCKICPLPTIRSHVFVLLAIVGNGQILEWDLQSVLFEFGTPPFPLFCVKTFEFAIQTWQTSLEYYRVYV